MIKFFRTIRQRLLLENKFNRYLLYAIGEIILVVIGILIALQINNLNEINKLKKVERNILKDIKIDLVQSKEDLLENAKSHELQIHDFNALIYNIEKTKIYNDTLATKFSQLIFWASPYLTLASYENLKTDKGIDLISNDSLKKKIVSLHENSFKKFMGDIEREELIHTETISRPAMFKYFIYKRRNEIIPKEYTALINDPEFLSILTFTRDLRKRSLFVTKKNINEIQVVIDAITKELEK